MKISVRILLLLIFALFSSFKLGAQKYVYGEITDENGIPLDGVTIIQIGTKNGIISNQKGEFELNLLRNSEQTLKFSHFKYNALYLHHVDTFKLPMQIQMSEATFTQPDTFLLDEFHYHTKFGAIFMLGADLISNDFNEFKSTLSEYNTSLLNESNGLFNIEIGATLRKQYLGVNFGYSSFSNNDHDSLDISLDRTQFGINYGFKLINSKHFLIMPKIAVKWNKYRLQNFDNEAKISLEQHMLERDLDLRFNQFFGLVGMNISYKLYNHNILGTDYWTFGFYGGYIFQLSDKPLIKSQHNRLTTDHRIKTDNLNIGVVFTFNYD